MGSASGSMALRVRKGCLPQLPQARANFGERGFDLGWRGAARNIVFCDYSPEFQGGGEIIAQQITELLARSGAQRFQSAAFINALAHHASDDFMGAPKWHAFAHQIVCRRRSI